MEVYALVGPSGTGKSHHAGMVMEQYHITVLIDDGLLIRHGKKLAGTSAKAEETRVGAVKRAIFHHEDHRNEVRSCLHRIQPEKLLILGTSEKMIERITEALELPPVSHIIYIQDIVAPEEIEIARAMRQEGKHVIPLPSIEVKKDLSNYWIDSIVKLVTKKNKGGKDSREQKDTEDKCIVRPRFSRLGSLTISNHAIGQIVQHILQQHTDLEATAKPKVDMSELGVQLYCELKVRYGVSIPAAVIRFQESTIEALDEMTNLTVQRMDVKITGIRAE